MSRNLGIVLIAAVSAVGAVVRAQQPEAQAALNRVDENGQLESETLRVWPGDGDESVLSASWSRTTSATTGP